METYQGHVKTPQDAIILFEACRLGLLPRVQRRLSEKERQQIKSGSVFVWDEREAGMRRWTDGKSWSASRVSGSFLTYREMEGKRGGISYSPGHGKKSSSRDSDGKDSDQERGEDGPDGYRYKPDGLMKQSFSITTSEGRHLHLISYYTRPPANVQPLKQPSTDPQLRNIRPQKGLYPEATVNEPSTPVPRSPAPYQAPPPPAGQPYYYPAPPGLVAHYGPPPPGWPSPVNTPPAGYGFPPHGYPHVGHPPPYPHVAYYAPLPHHAYPPPHHGHPQYERPPAQAQSTLPHPQSAPAGPPPPPASAAGYHRAMTSPHNVAVPPRPLSLPAANGTQTPSPYAEQPPRYESKEQPPTNGVSKPPTPPNSSNGVTPNEKPAEPALSAPTTTMSTAPSSTTTADSNKMIPSISSIINQTSANAAPRPSTIHSLSDDPRNRANSRSPANGATNGDAVAGAQQAPPRMALGGINSILAPPAGMNGPNGFLKEKSDLRRLDTHMLKFT